MRFVARAPARPAAPGTTRHSGTRLVLTKSKETVGRLDGKVVLIVGAATGAGRSAAVRFAGEGASVAIADVNKTGADEVVAQISANGGTAIALLADLKSEDDIRSMAAATMQAFGTIDVLHNNAAPLHLLARDGSLTELSADVIDEMLAVNVRGTLLSCKHVLPVMLARQRGVIINTASTIAIQADVGMATYAASKAAVMSITRSVATMYGRSGIRCNTIVPAHIVTERAKEKFGPEGIRLRLAEGLQQRLGSPEDFAALSLFLASDESEFIQGEAIRLDGGVTAHRPLVSLQVFNEIA